MPRIAYNKAKAGFDEGCIALMRRFIEEKPELRAEDIAEE